MNVKFIFTLMRESSDFAIIAGRRELNDYPSRYFIREFPNKTK